MEATANRHHGNRGSIGVRLYTLMQKGGSGGVFGFSKFSALILVNSLHGAV